MDQQRGRFVGIGVGTYTMGHTTLPNAVSDVRLLRALLGAGYDGDPVTDPTGPRVWALLEALPNSVGSGPLVALWSGHATAVNNDLRLLAADSGRQPSAGISATEIALRLADSGAGQILLIIDACFAGQAALPAIRAANAILRERPPEDPRVWVGVLASCQDVERAQDGEFGRRLRRLLTEGPTSPALRMRWSVHNERITGADLCDALVKEWDSDAQRPVYHGTGNAWFMLPNPMHRADAPRQVVEHLLLAARGGARRDQPSWFTGRTAEVDTVVGWVRDGRPGLYVVTGSAGTGKSAIVGRVVSLSDPTERDRLVRDRHTMSHRDPGEGSVDAHVHARGLTADRMAEMLETQLRLPGREADGRTNASLLVGHLQQAAEDARARPTWRPPVIVVDGLDEARGEAFTIARDLLLRLARDAVVIVATRDLPGDGTVPGLVDLLAAGSVPLDLDDPSRREGTRGDLHAYVTSRLDGVSSTMDCAAVADLLIGRASGAGDRPFLFARIVTDQLRARPVDTSRDGWQDTIGGSIDDAFEADLAAVPPPGRRLPVGVAAPALARRLLSALTWAYGAGFPEEEWIAGANALTTDGLAVGRDDVTWVLESAGRYVVQDGEAGQAVYRVAHQSLADTLRPAPETGPTMPFGPRAGLLGLGLLARYRLLLEAGLPATEPGYLWRYAWRHAADAGPDGLAALRDLAALDASLRADVALAALDVADAWARWGHVAEAVGPTEEAVDVLRDVTAAIPTYLADLATAVNNLSIRYSEVGRHHDALALAEEAVILRRGLAETNPAHLADVAGALINIAIRYSEVGRRRDALAPGEEAVALYRTQAQADATYRPSLALALTNLGGHYGHVGRPYDALASGEEAVALFRDLAADDPTHRPTLAMALVNLATHYGTVDRRRDAVPAAEEAVTIYRDLARTNPAHRPSLALALTNLATHYGNADRHHDAHTCVEESVALYRDLAAANPAHRPNLADALTNLGIRHGSLGHHHDALSPTEEAVALYRDLAADNPAHAADLAYALYTLSGCLRNLGHYHDALPAAEEAVALYGDLADDNPAYRDDLANALANLGQCHSDLGHHDDALPLAEEAVALSRELAADKPAYRANLANALNILGLHYSDLDRPHDALSAVEESLAIRRELAADDPLHRGALASALNNLGVYYRDLDRHDDAVAPTEEAVAIYRDLAATNPAHWRTLAGALTNLGARYASVGRTEEALPLAEEAVGIHRELAAADLGGRADMAGALASLGARLGDLGRHHDAITPTTEAVGLFRGLAVEDPDYVEDVGRALSSLGLHYLEAGNPGGADAVWESTIADLPAATSFLLGCRAAITMPGEPRAVAWITQALSGTDDRALRFHLHEIARKQRSLDPTAVDRAWESEANGAPAWLRLDLDLLATALAWIDTETYTAECDHLAAHPELLAEDADDAVAEALLLVPGEGAGRYEAIRVEARRSDVRTAYRPLLLEILANEFAAAELDEQRTMLAERREDLLTGEVRERLGRLASSGDDGEAQAGMRAAALVELAGLHAADALLDAVEGGTLPAYLHRVATSDDLRALRASAGVAVTVATSEPEAATAMVYVAIAHALEGAGDTASDIVRHARRLDPDQIPYWLNVCATVAQKHPAVLPLLTVLTEPLETAAEEARW